MESSGSNSVLWIVGSILALAILLVMTTNFHSSDSQSLSTQGNAADAMAKAASEIEASEDAAANAVNGAAPDAASPWTYNTEVDQVRGKAIETASSSSTNQVYFAAPYGGGSTLTLVVRKHPEYGTDVYFQIDTGQMVCDISDGCYATVRFDSGTAQRVWLNTPSDYSSNYIFVRGAKSFIAKLKAAKKVVVELEFYQQGRPQFIFDVNGLEWPIKTAA